MKKKKKNNIILSSETLLLPLKLTFITALTLLSFPLSILFFQFVDKGHQHHFNFRRQRKACLQLLWQHWRKQRPQRNLSRKFTRKTQTETNERTKI